MVAYSSLIIFANTTVRGNVWTALLLSASYIVCCLDVATSIRSNIRLTLAMIKFSDQETARLYQRTVVGVFIAAALNAAFYVITVLGVHFAATVDQQIGFARGLGAANLCLGTLGAASQLFFMRGISAIVGNHLASFKGSNQSHGMAEAHQRISSHLKVIAGVGVAVWLTTPWAIAIPSILEYIIPIIYSFYCLHFIPKLFQFIRPRPIAPKVELTSTPKTSAK